MPNSKPKEKPIASFPALVAGVKSHSVFPEGETFHVTLLVNGHHKQVAKLRCGKELTVTFSKQKQPTTKKKEKR